MTSPHPGTRLLALLLAALSEAGCLTTPLPPADATVLAAPTEALALSEGGQLKLANERGKVYVLVFYAVWCPVSRKMMKALVDISTPSRRQRGLVVLAIDEEDPDEKAIQFARAGGITGPIGLDRDGDFIRAMKVDTVPALVAVGRDGVVRRSHAGYHGEADLTELGREVDALLAAPREAAPETPAATAAPSAPTAAPSAATAAPTSAPSAPASAPQAPKP